jgi:hypothetical protein
VPARIIITVLEWVVTVLILMVAEKTMKLVWRSLKALKDARTVRIIAEK